MGQVYGQMSPDYRSQLTITGQICEPHKMTPVNILASQQTRKIDQCCCSNVLTLGGGREVVVSTAAFHARVRGLVPGLGGLKETKNVSSPSTCESQYCGEHP